MANITRRAFLAGLGAAFALGKERLVFGAEPQWESEQFKIPAGQNFRLEANDTHRVAVAWDGVRPETVKVVVVAQGNTVEIPGATQGVFYRTYNDWIENVAAKSFDLAAKERVNAKLPEGAQIPVVVVGAEIQGSAAVPVGWIVNGIRQGEADQARGVTEVSGEPKWTKSELKLGALLHEPTDHYVFYYIWDSSDIKSVKILVVESGTGIEIPGRTWAGEKWDIANDTFPSIIDQSLQFAKNKKGDKNNNIPADFNIPIIFAGRERQEGLHWANEVQAWRIWSQESMVADQQTQTSESLQKEVTLDPYKGQDSRWNPNTEAIYALPGKGIIVGSESKFKIVQGWDVGSTKSTIMAFIAPGWSLEVAGSFVGTVWEVEGDLGQLEVRALQMAKEKETELGSPVMVVWAHNRDAKPDGFADVPAGWKLR